MEQLPNKGRKRITIKKNKTTIFLTLLLAASTYVKASEKKPNEIEYIINSLLNAEFVDIDKKVKFSKFDYSNKIVFKFELKRAAHIVHYFKEEEKAEYNTFMKEEPFIPIKTPKEITYALRLEVIEKLLKTC